MSQPQFGDYDFSEEVRHEDAVIDLQSSRRQIAKLKGDLSLANSELSRYRVFVHQAEIEVRECKQLRSELLLSRKEVLNCHQEHGVQLTLVQKQKDDDVRRYNAHMMQLAAQVNALNSQLRVSNEQTRVAHELLRIHRRP